MILRRRESLPKGPVFVGGTGRSGTTILGQLLGAHSAYALISVEARFHCDGRGLPGVLAGKVTVDDFLERLRGEYFRRELSGGRKRGIHLSGVTDDDLQLAAERFTAQVGTDPTGAAASLLSGLFDPLTERNGARSWVEMSPHNIDYPELLRTMYPDSKLIHIVRDGRDVAASVARRTWGPDDPFDALDWWAARLRRAERDAIPDGYVLYVGLENLVLHDRDNQFDRIRSFLDLPKDRRMHKFFATSMSPADAHIGAWREHVPAADHDRYDHRYVELLEGLLADEIPSAAVLPGSVPAAAR